MLYINSFFMSDTRIVSEVYKIDSTIDSVYSFLSDFNRIGAMVSMARQMGAGGQMEQMKQITDRIEDIRFTEDTCTFVVKGMGEMSIKIVEKEYPKLIKLAGDEVVPFQFTLWIQLLENGPYDTRLRITLEAQLNMVMKMMLKGKLEKGVDQLAEGLTKIPYMMLK